MVIFFLAKLLANSSTVIGSNNASGPSSDIGRTETGCNSEHQLENNKSTTRSSLVKKSKQDKELIHFPKAELWQISACQ